MSQRDSYALREHCNFDEILRNPLPLVLVIDGPIYLREGWSVEASCCRVRAKATSPISLMGGRRSNVFKQVLCGRQVVLSSR